METRHGIRRRHSGAGGPPSRMRSGEIARNEVDGTWWYGAGDDGGRWATAIQQLYLDGVAQSVEWIKVKNTPTTLSGYGITDAVPDTRTITAGTGLSGGGQLNANRTLSIANTAVTAGTYGGATKIPAFTVNAQGQLTAAAEVSMTPAWSDIAGIPNWIDRPPGNNGLYGLQRSLLGTSWLALDDMASEADAPSNGTIYGRQNGGWTAVPAGGGATLTFGNGLSGTSYDGSVARTVTLGTPSTLTASTTNSTTSTSHTHEVTGFLPLTGGVANAVTGEVTFRPPSGFRLAQAGGSGYGVIFRRDSTNFNILLTDNNDPDGTWNSLRPFRVTLSTGEVAMSEGAQIAKGLVVAGGITAVNGAVSLTSAASVTAPTVATADSSTRVATTAWVKAQGYGSGGGGGATLSFGNGLATGSYDGSSAATVQLGTPTTLTSATTNATTTTGHSHKVNGLAPATITASTTNSSTASDHTHAITGFVPTSRVVSAGQGIQINGSTSGTLASTVTVSVNPNTVWTAWSAPTGSKRLSSIKVQTTTPTSNSGNTGTLYLIY